MSLFISCVCVCSDYGFERSHIEGERCFSDFWHDPDSPPDDCHLGQTFESSTGSVHVHKHTNAPSSCTHNSLGDTHFHFLPSSKMRRPVSVTCLCNKYGAGGKLL